MNEKTKPVYLGSLDVGVYFEHEGAKYRTITNMASDRWIKSTKRDCLNMTTLRAEYMDCNLKVVPFETNY
jgi:hypothetical protein